MSRCDCVLGVVCMSRMLLLSAAVGRAAESGSCMYRQARMRRGFDGIACDRETRPARVPLRQRLDALGPAPRAELLHVLMLPDLDRAAADRRRREQPPL
jgi:hypothetical protein